MSSTLLQLGQILPEHLSRWANHVRLLADPTPTDTPTTTPTTALNTNGIVTFLGSRIAPILLGFLGVVFIGRASRGEISKVLTSSTIAIVGLAFLAGAGTLFFFGGSLINTALK